MAQALTNARIEQLLAYVDGAGDGFANHCIWKPELAALLHEVIEARQARDVWTVKRGA